MDLEKNKITESGTEKKPKFDPNELGISNEERQRRLLIQIHVKWILERAGEIRLNEILKAAHRQREVNVLNTSTEIELEEEEELPIPKIRGRNGGRDSMRKIFERKKNLSPEETTICCLVNQGLSLDQIATQMNVPFNRVNALLKSANLKEKLSWDLVDSENTD